VMMYPGSPKAGASQIIQKHRVRQCSMVLLICQLSRQTGLVQDGVRCVPRGFRIEPHTGNAFRSVWGSKALWGSRLGLHRHPQDT
jgi:hypothetical protein